MEFYVCLILCKNSKITLIYHLFSSTFLLNFESFGGSYSTQFSPMLDFDTSGKCQKAKGFLSFSGSLETEHWT